MFNPHPKPEKSEKKKPKRINQFSEKRKKLNTDYRKVNKKYLQDHKACECGCGNLANQIHHKKGRWGVADEKEIPLLVDIRFFLAVCDDCHKKIEFNPNWAKEKGYSLSRLSK